MDIHDHGGKSRIHAHVVLEDLITCGKCGWQGLVSQCKVKPCFFFGDSFLCPNKKFHLFLCNFVLVVDNEEGGLLTTENVKLIDLGG